MLSEQKKNRKHLIQSLLTSIFVNFKISEEFFKEKNIPFEAKFERIPFKICKAFYSTIYAN